MSRYYSLLRINTKRPLKWRMVLKNKIGSKNQLRVGKILTSYDTHSKIFIFN